MKCKMLLTLGLFAAAVTTFARIRDTYIQSTNRFGKALGHFKDKYAEVGLFEYKGYAIFVRYRKGKSFEESYVFLAPGVKSKIKKEEYWEDIFAILNDPENLTKMTEKQRKRLRSANLKTTWKFKEIKPNGIEEQEAILGKRKVSGNYYIARKALVITNETAPRLKADANEIKKVKSMCVPLESKFKQYLNKYGMPFYLMRADWGGVQKENTLIIVSFNNKSVKDAIRNGRLHKTMKKIIKGLHDGISQKVDYKILTKKAFGKYSKNYAINKKQYQKYQDRDKLSDDEYDDLYIKSASITVNDSTEMDSLRPDIIRAFLEGTTKTKWKLFRRPSIHEIKYSTWKDGRRMYGTYNIAWKCLTIEYGGRPSDYKPDVIKKLKEKKATEALNAF
jgi:hypothetical protein